MKKRFQTRDFALCRKRLGTRQALYFPHVSAILVRIKAYQIISYREFFRFQELSLIPHRMSVRKPA